MKWYGNCLEWQGTLTQKGYGLVQLNGTNYRVHRLVYRLFHGKIPRGRLVLHYCDNPRCFNPTHLWIGNPSDNSRDMVKKGRSAYGEYHSQAKLKKYQILAMRHLYRNGVSQYELAKRFGVDQSNVSIIVNGKGWTK